MTSVRTTQKSSLLFRFFTIPFLLLLVIALAPTVGNFQNCDINTTVDQHQIYNLGDYWHSLRPSGGQPTRQLTTQRKNAQSTISLQKLSLPKAVP
jgi:hypothetical protein